MKPSSRTNPAIGPVVKVGGSLLDEPRLVPLLRDWLIRQAAAPAALIAGGGPWVDGIRAADERFALGDEAAHWLCIRAMRLTAQLLSDLLPEAIYTADVARIRNGPDRTFVLDAEDFLRRDEPLVEGTPLPHSWKATSDSIAARVAKAIGSKELVLLKSTLPPRHSSLPQAAKTNYDDQFLPTQGHSAKSVACPN